MTIDLKNYPTLSCTINWGFDANFVLDANHDPSLVSNVSIIPFVGDKVVIFQVDNGTWELPGGTLDENEHFLDGLKREAMEEIGAVVKTYTVFGHFHCTAHTEKRFRPYTPHPNFVRLVGYGDVEIVGEPLNPEDGEQVIAVKVVDIDEALRTIEGVNRHEIAELYKLAYEVRKQGQKNISESSASTTLA